MVDVESGRAVGPPSACDVTACRWSVQDGPATLYSHIDNLSVDWKANPMRIGYPCVNLTVGISASRTFRLASYSERRLIETIDANLDALQAILEWNADHNIRYFRISSGTIPFASHPVMRFDWRSHFAERLNAIGRYIEGQGMRVNVHPGQYTLLNSIRDEVVIQSVAELAYHADLLDGLGLDFTNKIQIHVGGVYGDKPAARDRFIAAFAGLPESIRRRLAVENDERQVNLADAMQIHAVTGVPVLFDVFHHRIHNQGESLGEALDLVSPTWVGHGPAMIDYSSQNPDKQVGAHAASIDLDDISYVLRELWNRDVDVMLEIKDKETSALRAVEFVSERRELLVMSRP
jgi:UV DNA damage endonuclease